MPAAVLCCAARLLLLLLLCCTHLAQLLEPIQLGQQLHQRALVVRRHARKHASTLQEGLHSAQVLQLRQQAEGQTGGVRGRAISGAAGSQGSRQLPCIAHSSHPTSH